MEKRPESTDPAQPPAYAINNSGDALPAPTRFKYTGPRKRGPKQGPKLELGLEPLGTMLEATPWGRPREGEYTVREIPGRGAKMAARGGKSRDWAIRNLGVPDNRLPTSRHIQPLRNSLANGETPEGYSIDGAKREVLAYDSWELGNTLAQLSVKKRAYPKAAEPVKKAAPKLPGSKDLAKAIKDTKVLDSPDINNSGGLRPTIDEPWGNSRDYRNQPDWDSKDPYAKLRNRRPGNTPLPRKDGN